MNFFKKIASNPPFGMFKKPDLGPRVAEGLANRMAASKKSKRKILLVDDDDQFQELVQHLQKATNADVMPAQSVGVAKALVEQRPFDLFIVDWNIPNGHPGGNGNGALLCDWIKQKYPSASVIVLTNSNPEEIAPELEKKTGRSIPVYGKGTPERLISLLNELCTYASSKPNPQPS